MKVGLEKPLLKVGLLKVGLENSFFLHYEKEGCLEAETNPELYLSQNPKAPWLCFELCSRNQKVGFYETRLNPLISVNTSGVIFQTIPGEKGYIRLVSNSYWALDLAIRLPMVRAKT